MSKPNHLLKCKHCVGSNCKQYYMVCDILKRMPDGRLKVKVYGDRYWRDSTNITKIRYVEAWRVTPREEL